MRRLETKTVLDYMYKTCYCLSSPRLYTYSLKPYAQTRSLPLLRCDFLALAPFPLRSLLVRLGAAPNPPSLEGSPPRVGSSAGGHELLDARALLGEEVIGCELVSEYRRKEYIERLYL